MCRLLGWASRVPTTLLDLLGEEDLNAFTELSSKHADGWGLARSTRGGVKVAKAADAARTSGAFARRAHGRRADLGLAHLRWATLGLDVHEANTHPFSDGRLAFAHNGSIMPPASLDRLISPAVAPLRRGSTDSERYFLAVLSRMAEGASPAEALAVTVEDVAADGGYSSLNCLLLTPDELHAVCRVDADAEPLPGEGPDYFTLRYRVDADAVVVASSGWGRDWQELADGELLTVRRRSLDLSVRPLRQVPVAS
jgi:predicted glutamine amidotransferase